MVYVQEEIVRGTDKLVLIFLAVQAVVLPRLPPSVPPHSKVADDSKCDDSDQDDEDDPAPPAEPARLIRNQNRVDADDATCSGQARRGRMQQFGA